MVRRNFRRFVAQGAVALRGTLVARSAGGGRAKEVERLSRTVIMSTAGDDPPPPEEAPLEGRRASGGVAGQAGDKCGEEALGKDGEHDVEVDVQVDLLEQASAQNARTTRESLVDGHPPGVPPDERRLWCRGCC